MKKTTRSRVIGETVTNLMLALTDNDPRSQQRQVIEAGVNVGQLLPDVGRTMWRFYHTHPGNPGSMPGPSGAQRK